jgi:DNA-binding response OmpR family regulator
MEHRIRPNALVIDDDPRERRRLREILEIEGWASRSGSRVDIGLKLAAIECPTIVLLDVNPPHYQAEALAMGLRIHFGPRLPIIALSGSLRPQAMPWLSSVRTLGKPVDSDLLKEQLRRAAARLELLALGEAKDHPVALPIGA